MYRALAEDKKQAIKASDKNKRQMTKENQFRKILMPFLRWNKTK